ncbi:MAG: UDP-N-acetylmuramoyl-tripeptide--D-alanyl-D-alanine ligase [Candidatus Pacebacteria bacterium]|nr:UDP-N-acetylmuramoyl-tripeptide--D-alanyl-D-alanine ligase [Candidatus Paceibacterota bacterium]
MLKNIFKKVVISIIQLEAKLVLKKYKPKIVAVTGSVGKTTTKDTIYTVLSSSFFVRKSEKSFNSEIGVPLTILGCENAWNNPFLWLKNILIGLKLLLFKSNYPKWMVLEVGADAPGDIENLAKWLKPDIAVITRFAKIPVHVEFFKSPQALMDEKKKLVKYLKAGGIFVKNSDDENVNSIQVAEGIQTISFGYKEGVDVLGSDIEVIYENSIPTGINFEVKYSDISIPIILKGVIGKSQASSVLIAVAVGMSLKLDKNLISSSIAENYRTQPGRMKLLKGIKETTLIDDSYNASPIAVEKALETLKDLIIPKPTLVRPNGFRTVGQGIEGGRKIAVLGDMLELGKYSTEEHKNIGKLVVSSCDILVTIGLRSRHIAEGALLGGMSEKNIFQFDDSLKAGKYLQNLIHKNDVILIKGSQSIRTEKITEEIMAYPEKKHKLLVRQEAEWNLR